MIFRCLIYVLTFVCICCFSKQGLASDSEKMVLIPDGTYIPFYPEKKAGEPKPVQVKAFMMDLYPVTNSEYLNFVRQKPDWRRSKIKRVFADTHYLQNWKSDLKLYQKKMAKAPVTFVSWFSAKAFCEAQGKELPTVDQWEYAAYDGGRSENETKERVLKWYSKPNIKHLAPVGSNPKNGFGIYDLQGLIWEWTYDFNNPSGSATNSFCGSSAVGAANSSDYVNFMRFAFRSSLKGSYTTANLGFRCVKEVKE
jgi:formylglycine-generating enzyme